MKKSCQKLTTSLEKALSLRIKSLLWTVYNNKFQILVQEYAIFRALRFPLFHTLVCMKAIDEAYATWFRFPNWIFSLKHTNKGFHRVIINNH